MRRVDAIIAGGGPSGACTAIALQGLGQRTLLVEQGDYVASRGADTLAASGCAVLEALGLSLARLGVAGRECNGTRSAWDDVDPVEQNALFNPLGPAWHVQRDRFDRALCDAAAKAGATVRLRASVQSVERAGNGWIARVERQGAVEEVRAATLVDATGRMARLARLQSARRLSYDRLVGIAVLLRPGARGSADGSMLLLEAAPQGWWYSAPLADGRLLACYLTDADLLPRGRTTLGHWRAALSDAPHSAARIARYRPAEENAATVRPAAVARLSRAAGPGWLAVGDAASSFDPLSGIGVAKAMQSGIAAARAIVQHGGGDATAFAHYEAGVSEDFAAHMRERAAYFGRVARFADKLFWRRRRPIDPWRSEITLDPLARLHVAETPPDGAAAAGLEGLLPRQELQRLRRLCAAPAEAHDVVTAFRNASVSGADDRATIVALQVLVESKVLQILPSGRRA